jgi:hypothetical protein
MRYVITVGLSLFMVSVSLGQSLDDLEDYSIDEFYKKVELDYGTLDEDGDEIDFIFVETEVDAGNYEIELTDGPGDLYEIKGTDIFISLNGYFGYAGYGTECLMEVTTYGGTVYKLED